ncbi:amino acid ABC transporter permease [Bordetella petrii]|uniref:amino acid ABC transporter permease n=1 Tax=Bordetella petrii TaxID=94624 RepID=UPI001E58230C|nr:amino acid ABC transporter permease [Bordetella petrii]MCD0503250.1 amino acid ABC transporter permease [Bordetella petrii]
MDFSFSMLSDPEIMGMLMTGVSITLRLFAGALAGGFAVALVLTGINLIPSRIVRAVVALYVEYHRNVPTVVQILVWYFGMPEILPAALRDWINQGNTEFSFALIALSLNVSAYYYEDIRSGMRAIAATQIEAARSIGLGAMQALLYVVLPQAVRYAVPPIVNRSIILFKDTSLAMVIGVTDLTYQTKRIENATFQTFQIFMIATLIYLCMALLISALGAYLARKYPASFKS